MKAARDDARALLYSRGPDDRAMDDHLAHLQSESYRIFLDMLLAPIKERVHAPVFVLGATGDNIFPPSDTVRTAKFYDVTPVMIDGSHMVMVDDFWRDCADVLLEWADGVVKAG